MFNFKQLAEQTFAKGRKLGFDEMELFALRSKSLGITVKNQQVEETKLADIQGLGVRVIKDKHWGYAYTADFSGQAVGQMLESALRNTTYSDRDEFACLPQAQTSYAPINLYDPTLANIDLADKIALAKEAERIAYESDARVIQIDKASYSEGEGMVWIANTNGVFAQEQTTSCSLTAIAIGADQNGQDSGFGMDSAIRFHNLNPRNVGEDAAKRAVRLLSAKTVPSMTCDIILPPETAVDILELIAGSFSGERVLKGRSMFPNLSETIASPLVTVIDDGHCAERLGSGMFDSEGVATQCTTIVKNGVLQTYLYDIKTAAEAGAQSTANAVRGSYRTAPSIGTTNCYIAPHQGTEADIIAQSNTAIYVTDILGGHTANTITGDFSFGISGLLIQNGAITHPVRGITMAGNFKDLLKNIDRVGEDITFFGTIGAPTLRIKNIRISG